MLQFVHGFLRQINHYSPGIYRITPVSNTNKCLDAYSVTNNQPVTVNGHWAGDTQKWRIVSNNDGATWRFIPTQDGGKSCITGYSNNTDVKMYEYNAGSYQKWTFEKPPYILEVEQYFDEGFIGYHGFNASQSTNYINEINNMVRDQFITRLNVSLLRKKTEKYISSEDYCRAEHPMGWGDYCYHEYEYWPWPLVAHTRAGNLNIEMDTNRPATNKRTTVLWTGYRTSYQSSEPNGVAFPNFNTAFILYRENNNFINDPYVKGIFAGLLAHEVMHTVGAIDHYCLDDGNGKCVNRKYCNNVGTVWGYNHDDNNKDARSAQCVMGNESDILLNNDFYPGTPYFLCSKCKTGEVNPHLNNHHTN